jgi:hypothetical protein
MMSTKSIFAPRSGLGGGGSPAAATPLSPAVLTFSPLAADRLSAFAETIEPRLAPGADLDPIVDWASKLVGATARIAGLLHLAALEFPLPHPPLPLSRLRGRDVDAVDIRAAQRSGGGGLLPPVSLFATESAIQISEYLIEHAKAAYAIMGLDPTAATVPTLLAWIGRTGRPTFTRRDARHAIRYRIRSDADLDESLDELEHHGYIRLRPRERRPGQGRPASPTYDVHPSLFHR